MMTEADADAVVGAGITRVQIRSVLECRARKGVCAHCYGINLSLIHILRKRQLLSGKKERQKKNFCLFVQKYT